MANAPSPNDLTRQQLDELDALLQRMLALPQSEADTPPPAKAEAQAPAAVEAPAAGWRADRPPAATPPRSPHLTAAPAPVAAPAAAEPVAGAARSNPFAFAPTPAQPVPTIPGSFPPLEPDPVPDVAFPFEVPTVFAPTIPPTPAVPFGPPTPETGVPPSAPASDEFDRVSLGPAPDFGPINLGELKPANEPTETTTPAAVVSPQVQETQPGSGVPVLLWPLFAANWLIEGVLGLFGPPGQALASTGMKHLLGLVGIVLLIAAGVWTANGMGWIQLPVRVP